MPAVITELIISLIASFVLCMAYRHLHRKRAFSRLVVQACPACSRIYGHDILPMIKQNGYVWIPAPGYSVSSLQLPSSTFLVTCPRCSAKTEFTQAGFVFNRPKEGVKSFRRIVRA